MSKWSTVSCEDCGCEIFVHEDWDQAPRFCKECKARHQAQWYERSCRHCGGAISVHRDWDTVPDFHKECAWYTVNCQICGGSLEIHRAWENPHRCTRNAEQSRRPNGA